MLRSLQDECWDVETGLCNHSSTVPIPHCSVCTVRTYLTSSSGRSCSSTIVQTPVPHPLPKHRHPFKRLS